MAIPVLLLIFLAVILVAGYALIRFAFSDADGLLLSKGPLSALAFKDKVVWITGASQGIGESLAYKLAKQGAHLILSSRNKEKLNGVKVRCEALSSEARVSVVVLDLAGGSEGLQAAVKEAEAACTPHAIHYLIHNAGHPRPKLTCEESSEEFLRALFEVNVFAPIELTRAALPAMRQHRQGRIVAVSSVAGKVPSPTQGVYAASKHALNGYFHTLRAELSGSGVEVTVVCPGPIAPPLSAQTEGEDLKNRMTSDRCADLILAAAFYGVDEAWISPHPVLAFMYLFQFVPRLGYHLMRKIGPKRVHSLKSGGKDLYSTNLMFSASPARYKST